ncbi:MAG: hypothetical protein WBP91_09975, partial [Terriglobales bacterium]
MAISSKAGPSKTALTKSAPATNTQKPASESLDQLQDAIFIFTTDLRGIITGCSLGCNQGEGPQSDRFGFVPTDLVGRNVADFYAAGQQIVFPSQAMADVIEKGRFEGALRCRTKSGQEMDVQL